MRRFSAGASSEQHHRSGGKEASNAEEESRIGPGLSTVISEGDRVGGPLSGEFVRHGIGCKRHLWVEPIELGRASFEPPIELRVGSSQRVVFFRGHPAEAAHLNRV